ncbi:hypothetical protein [uncultured Ruegeria sp.]|nr:hypothetical protein [uncultured Ruegeria sp.]
MSQPAITGNDIDGNRRGLILSETTHGVTALTVNCAGFRRFDPI